MALKTLNDIAQQVQTDDAFKQELKDDPEAALAKQAAAYTSDPKFYRIAVGGLIGIIVLVILCAVVVQIWKDKNISDWESALATTALGGLVGLFAQPPSSK
jgi:uncharacterized membrane protein YhaH (DUF805 family)